MPQPHNGTFSAIAPSLDEQRYCGPCGEYYTNGDVLQSADTTITYDCHGKPADLSGRECPFCGEVGTPIDELAERAAEEAMSDPPVSTSHYDSWVEKQHAMGRR